MYIVNSAEESRHGEILNYLPKSIGKYMYNIKTDEAYELHIASGKPVCIYFSDGRYCISKKGTLVRSAVNAVRAAKEDIARCMELITGASMYSVDDELCRGYITVPGGHRVGIVGSAVKRNGKISFMKDISALNFRIASEVKGAADKVISYIADENDVRSTLIISPPGAGKTTMLRDIARQLSYMGKRVCIADERGELAAMNGGVSGFDLGMSCDVLTGADKAEGMTMLLRSMSPEVIVTDEIGSAEDAAAVKKLMTCGVAVIASAHGGGEDDIKNHCDLGNIIDGFGVIITLSKRNGVGTIEDIRVK